MQDLLDDEDDAFLRPAAPALPRRKSRAAASGNAPELVPNYASQQEAEAFMRGRRRLPPRRGGRLRGLLQTRTGRILIVALLLVLLAALAAGAWAVRSFLRHDPHFRIDSSASIEATGITELSRSELVNVFGSDIGRNIFFVPLARREAALEAQPWVRHATVMRLLPHTLRVTIVERVPIAFVRIGHQIGLIDADGVLLNMAPGTLAARHYSFPVVVGIDPASPAPARAERMRLYQRFVAALDAGSDPKISPQLSEVDLADLDDVRAVVPAQGSDLLLHFGNSDYLERYHSYQEHLAEWRQQYPNLSAVDLRYDRQVVLKMADAAQADEDAEARQQAGAAARKEAPVPARHTGKPATAAHTLHPAAGGHPAAKPAHRPANTARVWYSESRGPHGVIRWVPHYFNQGRAR